MIQKTIWMENYGRLDGIFPGNNVECWWHLVLRPYLSTLGSRNWVSQSLDRMGMLRRSKEHKAYLLTCYLNEGNPNNIKYQCFKTESKLMENMMLMNRPHVFTPTHTCSCLPLGVETCGQGVPRCTYACPWKDGLQIKKAAAGPETPYASLRCN